MPLPYEFPLRTADLWENGRSLTTAPTFPGGVQLVGDTGGATEAYTVNGAGARWRITTDAVHFELDVASNWTQISSQQSSVAIRINDGVSTYLRAGIATHIQDRHIGTARGKADGSITFETFRFSIETLGSKRIEIYVSGQHAAPGQPPYSVFPIRLRSDKELVFTAPAAQTYRLGILGDSIPVGQGSILQPCLGYAGLFKRGLMAQFGTLWKGAYSGATTYAVGELVSSGTTIWQKLTAAAAGTAPVVGANWAAYGFNGSVELYRSWGAKSVTNDWSTSGNRTTYAADIASKAFTHLLIADGINDHFASVTTANFTTYENGRFTALAAAQPGLKIVRLSPILNGTNGNEAANTNSNGNTPPDFRAIMVSAVAAASGFTTPPVYLNGLPMLAVGDLQDWIHPTTAGHAKLPNQILPSFV